MLDISSGGKSRTCIIPYNGNSLSLQGRSKYFYWYSCRWELAKQDICNRRQLMCVGVGGQLLLFAVMDDVFFYIAVGRVLQRFRKGSLLLGAVKIG